MTSWLSDTLSRARVGDDWLAPMRHRALNELQSRSWPTRKTEAWKYLPVNQWERVELGGVNGSNDSFAVPSIADLACIELHLVDGQLRSGSELALPSGLSVKTLNQIDAKDQSWVRESFKSVKPERHLFGLVNDLLAPDVLVVDVQDGVKITQPLRIHVANSAGVESHTRVLVRVGENADVSIVEDCSDSSASRATYYTEYLLRAKAKLQHYRLQMSTGNALHIGGCHFSLAGASHLVSNVVAFGSQLSRLDLDIIHKESGALAELGAVYLLAEKEIFDLHATVEHECPEGTTSEKIRGIVGDNARAVFNGRIHIHRDAQKTVAELNNRNLLLSRRAEIDTKPELEIYADDVRCAHGATIAEMDQQALFYLTSRGVSVSKAQELLNFGFINELLAQFPHGELADWLRPQLRQRFVAMEVK